MDPSYYYDFHLDFLVESGLVDVLAEADHDFPYFQDNPHSHYHHQHWLVQRLGGLGDREQVPHYGPHLLRDPHPDHPPHSHAHNQQGKTVPIIICKGLGSGSLLCNEGGSNACNRSTWVRLPLLQRLLCHYRDHLPQYACQSIHQYIYS